MPGQDSHACELEASPVSTAPAGAWTGPRRLVLESARILRHLVLGAVLRPRIGGSRLRRAALAFLLVDETFGFAVAAGDSADRDGRPGDHSGRACYLAWQVGTLIGVLGAGLPGIEGVTSAIFPVLFIGLASLACRTRSHVLRALGAAALTVGWPFALPNLRAARRRWRGRCASGRGDG
jgi:predicted branched-subunit amino acid permease